MFTLLEDFGYLLRVAFNLDNILGLTQTSAPIRRKAAYSAGVLRKSYIFKKSGAHGK